MGVAPLRFVADLNGYGGTHHRPADANFSRSPLSVRTCVFCVCFGLFFGCGSWPILLFLKTYYFSDRTDGRFLWVSFSVHFNKL